MASIFSQEYAVERYGDEREANGFAEGALNQAKSTALQMKKEGLPEAYIAEIHHVDLQTVRQWLAESPEASGC